MFIKRRGDDRCRHLLCGPLAAIRLLEYALVVAGLTPLARWALLGTDALHFEPSADRARSGSG